MTAERVLLVVAHHGRVDQADACLERAFRAIGCEVHIFDYQATTVVPRRLARFIPQRWRRYLSPRRLPVVERADASVCNQQFLARVAAVRPTLIVALRAERLTAATVLAAGQQGAITMNWVGDMPWQFNPPETAPAYDLWVTADRTWTPWLMQHGARRVEHLPFACDPALHQPAALSATARARWHAAICFVGSYTPPREELLAAIADLGLGIWGPGWAQARHPQVRAAVRDDRMLRRDEWLAAYAAADVVINIQSQGEEGLSLRVWEALAAGACLVTDDKADVHRFLDGVATTFRDARELRARCQELLADPARRQQFAQQGRAHVVAHHTFAHRAQQLLDWAHELTPASGRR